MTTAVTTPGDVQHVAEQVAAGLDQLLHAEYWKLPAADLLNAARTGVRAAQAVLPQDAISGGEIPPRLPALGHALRGGVLGAEQVSIVVKTMSRIPTDIPPDIREQAETTLVGHAQDMDPTHLGVVATRLIDALDPDGDFEPRDPADRAELTLGVRDARTGLTGIKGASTTSPSP